MTTYTQNGTSSDELLLCIQDLGDNPTSRVPVALCLDVSGSMAGDPIRELNQGVKDFYQALREDIVAAHSAEVAVVAFAERAELIVDFQSLQRATPPTLEIGDRLGHSTNLGAGVELALNSLNQRKKEIEYAGVDYHQPFLVIMTDGAPTTDGHISIAKQTRELEQQRKLCILPIGIGSQAKLDVLNMFSGKRPGIRLKGLCFAEFFEWLSKTVIQTSHSCPGDRPPTPGPITGWADL